MKNKKLLFTLICSFLTGLLIYGQQYADTLSFGKLDTEADLDGYPEFSFNYENGATFPLDQTFTFTAGDVGSTKDVNVNVVITVEGHKLDRVTREVIDSTVYLNYRDDKYISISGWPNDQVEGVQNGDYRQINDDEMLTLTFKTVNNTPPNEVYPPVQMSLFGIGAWGNSLAATEVYLNDELVGYWIASGTTQRVVTPIVTDVITQEPLKLALKEGDKLQLKGVTNPPPSTYFRLVGFAMLMESTLAPTTLNLTVEGGNATITDLAGSLRILGEVLPEDASDKRIVWSVQDNGTGAKINTGGVLMANPRQSGNGTVKVIGTLTADGSITSSVDVTISGQYDVPVSSITVSSVGNDTINENGGTLQMRAEVLPEIAAEKDVAWSVIDNGTGATIDAEGLLQANPRDEGNGTVQVVAIAADGSDVKDTLDVVIMGQETTFVELISILHPGDFPEITENNGTLQLTFEIVPETASDKTVTWSVDDQGTGATIDQNGLLVASGTDDGNGTVTVTASANDGSEVAGTLDVTIIGQVSPSSVNQNDADNLVVVYPNPVSDGQKLNVIISERAGKLQSVSIHQINGQEIASYLDFSGNAGQVEVSISETPGIYLIKVITTEGTHVQRVMRN